jgi:hypothetical protein
VLMFVHTYIVLGMGKGALYEIIAMRELGASRAEVMETVRLGALHGGRAASTRSPRSRTTTCASGTRTRRLSRGSRGPTAGRPMPSGSGRGSICESDELEPG